MKRIPLTQGQFALVDDWDFKRFGAFNWHARFCPSVNGFYAGRTVRHPRKTTVYLHREILRAPKDRKVDHKNHDTLDCRRENLRLCTDSQNMHNRSGAARHSKSGVLGVHWHRRARKWTSQLRVEGKVHHLGLFLSIAAAASAYSKAREKYCGTFGAAR